MTNEEPTNKFMTKSFWETTHHLLLSLAIVIGGGWTMYTFESTLTKENAKAQQEKIKRYLSKTSVINRSLVLKRIGLKDKGYLIKASVFIENVGNNELVLDYSEHPITATLIEVGPDQPALTNVSYSNSALNIDGSILIPNQKKKEVYLVKVGGPGLYLIEYAVKVNPKEISGGIEMNLDEEELFITISEVLEI